MQPLLRQDEAFLKRVRDSRLTLIILSEQRNDVTLALQIGTAILAEKPIIVCAFSGVPVPAGLRPLSAAVIETADAASAEDALLAAITRVLGSRLAGDHDDD